jgi:phosphoglycolate phosphatase
VTAERPLSAALFDLDGTLLDTAPDFVHALNALRAECDLPAMPFAPIRAEVSNGALAVTRVGFPEADEPRIATLRDRLLQLYRANIARETRLFPGFEPVLDLLDAHRIPWGIITNKHAWLTEPLLQQLGLFTRAACVLSGDTLQVTKPHPLPLLTAAGRIGIEPARCLYLGDALRDAQAARAAGMTSLGARFGYIGLDEDVSAWPVDGWLDTPFDLLPWVGIGQT